MKKYYKTIKEFLVKILYRKPKPFEIKPTDHSFEIAQQEALNKKYLKQGKEIVQYLLNNYSDAIMTQQHLIWCPFIPQAFLDYPIIHEATCIYSDIDIKAEILKNFQIELETDPYYSTLIKLNSK